LLLESSLKRFGGGGIGAGRDSAINGDSGTEMAGEGATDEVGE